MDHLTGKLVNNRYRIQSVIGMGGMAVVYRATDVQTGTTVAVKVLKQEFLADEQFRVRFENESRAVSILNHKNIVKVYDVSLNDDLYYIVMEYLDGITLKQYIKQQGKLGWRESLYFLSQLLEALRHAHSKGIVHRDIKPQNIMLLADGSIKVTDFGIARFSSTNTNTMTDKAIGSVHYISPEQVAAERIDQRSDIYSVGITLYEMLTGELPFDAENPVSVALMQLQMSPPPPRTKNPDIPEGLEEIVLKCMEKEPGNRYPSVEALIEDVERFKQNPSIRFEYKYLSDENPTKYMDAIRLAKDEEEFDDLDVKDSFLKRLGGIMAAVVLLGFAVLLVLHPWNKEERPVDIQVPKLVGKTLESIMNDEQIQSNFSIVEGQSAYQDDYDTGVIFKQSPKEGMMVKSGAEIRVSVSLGRKTFEMPNFVGDNYLRAEVELTKMGASFETVREYSDTVAEDFVIATEPAEGGAVESGQTVVIRVSQGPQIVLVDVPKVIGLTEAKAKSELEAKGLSASVSRVDSDRPVGEVIAQNPAEGQSVGEGSSISLEVSNGSSALKDREITVTFPQNPETIELVIKQDGEVVHRGSYQTSKRFIRLMLHGKGLQIVEIYINGALQESGYVDFDS
ncbi:MAG: Stk1 family PASTA domain-containing Ser/Thr kinase [Clostridia bacterium]|nr:Stk1 family PASTA domain-containing Ser/Thr kinase [Clostridia bacterium]